MASEFENNLERHWDDGSIGDADCDPSTDVSLVFYPSDNNFYVNVFIKEI
jgi:hypothetical protein